MFRVLLLLFAAQLFAIASPRINQAQSWRVLASGNDTNLRSISAVYYSADPAQPPKIAAWASGSNGAVLRSLDDGKTWSRLPVLGGERLDFRGIVAFDDQTAYLMSSGDGEASRIYKTTDGGAKWMLQYSGERKPFFLDSIACLSETTCFALGDPIDGKFLILRTTDGLHWAPLPPQNLPAALPKEGAFAASNSNLLVISEREFFVITGGFAARILHTIDGGQSWTAVVVPIASDNSGAGIFSIARSPQNQFVAVGGDYTNPTVALRVAAISPDSGNSWQSSSQQPAGYRSAAAAIDGKSFLAVGPTGSDFSSDAGNHWNSFSAVSLNALSALDPKHVYAAGTKGTITQFISFNPD
jgi:photosystem II stability/assembly factor-like uncharacterized protein